MPSPPSALRLVTQTVPATPAQRTGRRVKAAAHADALVCGCGSTLFVALVAGPVLSGGRVTGGAKRYACAACWVAGRLMVIA